MRDDIDSIRSEEIKRLWNFCPSLTIRSTFIVGFPGETDADFELLLDWLDEAQLDRVGCFKYEAVEGAVANDLAAAVPDEVKEETRIAIEKGVDMPCTSCGIAPTTTTENLRAMVNAIRLYGKK